MFLSSPLPPTSSHFFCSLSNSQQTNVETLATQAIGTPTRPPSHCFGRPAIQLPRLLLARFSQAFLCSVSFVFFCIGSQVNYKLRQLSETAVRPVDAERFKRLANSVEEFTYRLLDPLKTDSETCEYFGYPSLDKMLNYAIEFEQKKVKNKKFDKNFTFDSRSISPGFPAYIYCNLTIGNSNRPTTAVRNIEFI